MLLTGCVASNVSYVIKLPEIFRIPYNHPDAFQAIAWVARLQTRRPAGFRSDNLTFV